MNKRKINELYEQAYVVHEVPYHSSVVDPTIVSVSKQKVWDQYLFAELIVRECARIARNTDLEDVEGGDSAVLRAAGEQIKEHFGVEE